MLGEYDDFDPYYEAIYAKQALIRKDLKLRQKELDLRQKELEIKELELNNKKEEFK